MKKFILTMSIVGSLLAMNVVAFSAPTDLTKNELATFEALSTKYNANTTNTTFTCPNNNKLCVSNGNCINNGNCNSNSKNYKNNNFNKNSRGCCRN